VQETIHLKNHQGRGRSRNLSDRLKNRPSLSYPSSLPITARRVEIIQALSRNRVVIISGETGSGKTTQIPKMCLEAGRGVRGIIGCTQPRRVAAVTVAERIAEELGQSVGQAVGYRIRFEDRSGSSPYIRIMTDGILLMETQSDPLLRAYDTIIVDEAHERNLNIDFLLGYLKTLLRKRNDLKLIITSATLDTEKFAAAFGGAPVIEVTGRVYPVEVLYRPIAQDGGDSEEITPVEAAVQAVEELRSGSFPQGDILIFMPTEQDIRDTCELLEGKGYDRLVVLPLFARLSWAEQRRVFSPAGAQKIVVATNIAETSLTIPGIRYVIDTGLARISQYNPRNRTNSLPVRPISRSSADQRKGRCGRVQDGLCIRLYEEEDYLNRPQFSAPEILRSNLAEVILRMLKLQLGHPAAFPFIDAPNPKSIRDGFEILRELGAISLEKNQKSDLTEGGEPGVRLTERGRRMARLPMDPRIARILLEAEKEGCVEEATVIASGLCIQDPRERPADEESRADAAHRLFRDPTSDFVTLLRIWEKFHQAQETLKSQGKMRKYCREHYLSWRRMREWRDIYDQIRRIRREEEKAAGEARKKAAVVAEDLNGALHRSILSGYLSGIAEKKEKNLYSATRGREAMLFPGSGLFSSGGNWIVAAEMVETSRLFARTAANIQSEWIEALAGDLCTSTYSEPHWEKNREEVVAFQQVSLFGLVIVSRRKVSYALIDPEESSRIFIRSALVEGELKRPPPFLSFNRKLVAEVIKMEDKIRRRELLQDESVLADFYASRLPGICDSRRLLRKIREEGGDSFLRMTPADVLARLPDEQELALFPDEVRLGGRSYPCVYRFDPGGTEDGVTLKIPDALLSEISPAAGDWAIPGLLRDRVLALLRGLPKEYRKKLHPLAPTADFIVGRLDKPSGPLLSAMAGLLRAEAGVDIPASAWSGKGVPSHLQVRFAVLDAGGREKAAGRDLALLQQTLTAEQDHRAFERVSRQWEKDGLRVWDFGNLPESIDLDEGGRFQGCAWPALAPGEGCVRLRLYRSRGEAAAVHRQGVAALYGLHFSRELKDLKKALKLPEPLKTWAEDWGGTRKVESLLLEKVTRDLFALDIRSAEAFLAHARKIAGKILSSGQEALGMVETLLKAYSENSGELGKMEWANRGSSGNRSFILQRRKEMAELLPGDFLCRFTAERLAHTPRYLKALKIRTERGLLNREKDRQREQELQSFVARLQERRDNLSPLASEEKKKALADLSLMIEEFKVSLFAQELKTAFPVSARRLEEKLDEIDRMF